MLARRIYDSWPLFLGMLLLMISNGLLVTLLTTRATELGFSQTQIAFMQAAYPLAAVFGCLVALLQGGRPILGLIDMPILEEHWLGAAGHPTTFTDRQGAREARARPCAELSGATVLATSPDMFTGDNQAAFERLHRAAKLTLYGGDCFNYGLLASGFSDIVIEAELAPYDHLAHAPIITGAGGVMTDWQGRPTSLETDGRVLCAGDPACHAEALSLLQSV